jgi:4-hydroxy-2-oxoheptanedioate aldolase
MKIENELKRKLSDGKVVCGCTVATGSPELTEIMGYHGMDYAFIDTEHGPIYSNTDLVNLVRAAEISGMVPLVRVKENQEHFVRNALEAGAKALVFPHVRTREDAQNAVKYTRFPPQGIRGVNPFVRAGHWGADLSGGKAIPIDEYVQSSNNQIMVIALIEDKLGVENIDEILSVEGIDALSFGPVDYSLSMGIKTDDPLVDQAFELVVKKGLAKNIQTLTDIYPATEEKAKEFIRIGVRFLLLGLDVIIFNAALSSLMHNVVKKIR